MASARHNGGMEITSQQNYAATPEQVYAMFTDPAYFETLCREFGAQDHSVNVANNSSQLSLKLPAPQIVQKFAGATLGLNQSITWGEAAADGSRVGQLDMSVDKMPVQVKGTAQLLPSGGGTTVNYRADMDVKIPLVGKKIEKEAAPYVQRALDAQQKVGNDYLAARA